jgi:selenium metabolism protein YedF
MGQGDDELGRKLMKTFINIIGMMDNMPSLIAFYNSGVKLTVKDSGVDDILMELEKRGVRMLICSTCIDYFGIGDKIAAGEKSNMFVITSELASAGNIIRP